MPAPSVVASEEVVDEANGTTLTVSLTTSGSNRGIVVGFCCDAAVSSVVTSITFNGSATGWGVVANTSQTVDAVHIEKWLCTGPAAATANVVITCSPSTPFRAAVVRAIQDMAQENPVADSDSAQGTGTTAATPTLTVPVPDCLALDFMVLEDPENPTPHGSQTLDEEGLWDSSGFHYAASRKEVSVDATMSYTFGNDTWAIAGVILKPASGGGGGPPSDVLFTTRRVVRTSRSSLMLGGRQYRRRASGLWAPDTRLGRAA